MRFAVWQCPSYFDRLEPAEWKQVATGQSYAEAAGKALRRIEELGGRWIRDHLRGLWEQVEGGEHAVCIR